MWKDLLEGKPLRHPLHPMLVHFPIGFFVLSLILDTASLIFTPPNNFARTSFYAIVAGLIGGIVAAVPGLADYSDIRRDHPAKGTARLHLILNLIVIAVYGSDLYVRTLTSRPDTVSPLALVLSLLGIGLLSFSGYLGGRLVYDDGIGVGRHRRHMPPPVETIHLTSPIVGADAVFVPIMAAQQLRERETLRVEISGQVMAIVRLENELFAFQEFCTHRFGPLSEGKFDGFNVQCPWHNSCFDVRTGKVTRGPAKVDLKVFKLETREGKVGIVIPRPG